MQSTGDTCTPVPNFELHSHIENQEAEYNVFKAENSLKRQCQVDTVTDIKELFRTNVQSPMISYKKIRSSMAYNRKKVLPVNPSTIDDATEYFNSEEIRSILTFADGANLLHKMTICEGYAFAIFRSKKILQNLPELRSFHITTSMRVITNGCFKVLMTFAIMKETQVRISIIFIKISL